MVLAVLCLRTAALNRLPKTGFLVLWGIVIVRLLVPFTVSSRWSAFLFLRSETGNTVIPVQTGIPVGQIPGPLENLEAAGQETPFCLPVWAVWLPGAAVLLTVFVCLILRSYRRLRFAVPFESETVSRWASAHKLRRGLRILQSDRIQTPLAVGIIRPRIILPKGMETGSPENISYILTHEYFHLRRFDMLWKLFALCAVCVHWFNPLAWIMLTLLNRDLEITCDEMVLRHFGGSAAVKKAYAYSLIEMAEIKSRPSPLQSAFGERVIEERIHAIMKMKKATTAAVILACLVILGITVVLATSPVSERPGTVEQEVQWNSERRGTVEQAVRWNDGIAFSQLEPGAEMTRPDKITMTGDFDFSYALNYTPMGLTLTFGLRAEDDSEYCRETVGGAAHGTIPDVPAGTYQLFIRSGKDYSAFANYRENPDDYAAVGCINFLVSDSGGVETAFTGNQADAASYAVYEPFGLTVEGGKLYYDGTLVRCFDDRVPARNFSVKAIGYYEKDGLIDVRAVREDHTHALTALAVSSRAEFENRVIDTHDEKPAQAGTNLFAPYEEFGLQYDESRGALFYNGKRVRLFWDSRSGDFSPGMSEKPLADSVSNWDPNGEIDVYALRDFSRKDADGYGSLTGLRAAADEEFDSSTGNFNW